PPARKGRLSYAALSGSRALGFVEQPAPYVEERPTDEHGSPEQDESGNDGHRQRDDRNHLELDQVVPTGGPLRQERSVLALHDLEAAPEVLRDPTRHVAQAIR